jgi:hypothetical protein
MADVYPTAAGAWSTRTWNDDATGAAYGGPPLAGDNVHANGVAITIDVDITVAELRTTAGTTAVAGGSFMTSGNRVVNADSLAGTTSCLTLATSSLSIQNGNSFGSLTTNSMVGTIVGATCIQNGNATGGNGTNRNGSQVNSGGILNGNSNGGSGGSAMGSTVGAGGILNGNSNGGSAATALGTNCSGIHNGNATGGSVSGAHGTNLAAQAIHNGSSTGGSVSGAHGTTVNAGGMAFITTATGNTSGAFGVSSTATSRYVAIIQNESGSFAKSLTAQAETTSVNVPFVSFEDSGGPASSIFAYGSAS